MLIPFSEILSRRHIHVVLRVWNYMAILCMHLSQAVKFVQMCYAEIKTSLRFYTSNPSVEGILVQG